MNPDYTQLVRNQSDREMGTGWRKLIVIHTTEGHDQEGITDLKNLASLFDNSAAQASSHVANDREGHDARYVPDHRKAWTSCGFNAVSLNIEQIGFASFMRHEWLRQRHAKLANTARWLAHWSEKHGIPLQRGRVSGSIVTKRGVVGHYDLGAFGCGHHDPGSGYPMRYVIDLARYFKGERKPRLIRRLNRVRKRAGVKPLPKERR